MCSNLSILKQASKGKQTRAKDVGLSFPVKRIDISGVSKEFRSVAFVDSQSDTRNHGCRSISQDAAAMTFYSVPWVLNSQSCACMSCEAAFSRSRWRHHCRICGFLVCNNCSKRRVQINIGDSLLERRGSRVCDRCYESMVPT